MVSHSDLFSKSLDLLFIIIQFDLFNDCHPRYVTLKSRARMINVKCRRHELCVRIRNSREVTFDRNKDMFWNLQSMLIMIVPLLLSFDQLFAKLVRSRYEGASLLILIGGICLL